MIDVKKYDCNFSMNDLFCNMLLGFVCLFMFALLMIVKSESKQDKQVETRAEFLITVTWPNDFDDDVDTYVEDPAGNIVAFNRREGGLMHLDRDDFGVSNDKVTVHGKDIFFKENRETVSADAGNSRDGRWRFRAPSRWTGPCASIPGAWRRYCRKSIGRGESGARGRRFQRAGRRRPNPWDEAR